MNALFIYVVLTSILFLTSFGSIAEENNSVEVWEGNSELQDELHFLRLERFLGLQLNIASTKAETSLQSTSTVTVIDRKMLAEYNFASVSSAVQTLAGMQVYRTYVKQRLPTARGVLQDHYANKVLIMLNNVPSWHAVTGESNLDRVSIHDVERIEVLRGPASVIYGTQAYTGAINIVLKKSAENSSQGKIHANIGDANGIGTNYYYAKDDLSVFAAINKERGPRYNYAFTDEKGINGQINDYH